MSSNKIAATVHRLCQASLAEFSNQFAQMQWPDRIPDDAWCTSPELISIFGTDHYQRLADTARRRLSLLEAVNFFSLNIHGERSLIEGLASRLYRKDNQDIWPYLHHFLDEENKHMMYFGTFCTKYGGKIYPDRKLVFPREYAQGEEDFLFFTKAMIFEELVDVYNVRMSLDKRLHPLAREINSMHHKDEARHLVFGREIVKDLFSKYKHTWTAEKLAAVREYVAGYCKAAWREYYNAEVYRDLGLENSIAVQADVWNSTAAHRQDVSRNCLAFLLSNEILIEEPGL